MNDFYAGTSAYKLDRYEQYTQKTQKASNEKKAVSQKAKIANQAALCRLLIVGVVTVFIACSALVYVNVMALRASTEIDNLEKKLALAVDKNKQKEIEINKNLDMKVIEKKAIEKLGMQKPDNSQIVYINVKKGTHSEAINPNASSQKAKVSGVKKMLMSIKEYFS